MCVDGLVLRLQTVRLQRLWRPAAADAAPLHPVFGCDGWDALLRRSDVHRLPAPPEQGELSKKVFVYTSGNLNIKDYVWAVGGSRS